MENNNGNGGKTVVLGESTEAPTTETTATAEAPEVKTDVKILEGKSPTEVVEKETISKKEDDKTSPKKEEAKEETKEELAKKDDKEEPFKVAFKKEDVITPTPTLTKETATEVTEEAVLGYLQANGINVSATSELSQKEVLPTAVAKFKEFVEKTGRDGIKDFYNAQRDWAKEPKETTIKEFLRYQNPQISEEDIDRQYQLKLVEELTNDEIGDLEDRDLREREQRQLDFNKLSVEAVSFMAGISKELGAPMESSIRTAKPPTAEQIAEQYRPYREARDKSLTNLNEIVLPLEMGDIKIPISKDMKGLISNISETQESFFTPFADKEGRISKQESTDPLVEALAWYHPETRQQMQISMLEQFHALTLDKFSKENRNVDLGEVQQITQNESQESGMVEVQDTNKKSFIAKPIF